ncbi:MAG: hypothetical protein GX458_16305 [Phyllobacteriaceae bacterium]|nr:hypothetical protein [Phyllobacteriaceae bacterium]
MTPPPSPRTPSSATAAPPPPTGFARAWRFLLPLALAIVALAFALGVFDTTARPAWTFVVGAGVGLVGLASLGRFLYAKSRQGLAELEDEFDRRFGEETKK